MVMGMEYAIANNVIQIFFGSELVAGIVMGAFLITILALTRVPIILAAPTLIFALLIIATFIPAITFLLYIIGGIIIASLAISLLGGR